MTVQTHARPTTLQPRLLRRERAAAYLDVSPSTFDKLVRDGLLPAPKTFQNFKTWDRADLDAFADHLPYAGESSGPDDSWS